MLQRRSLILFLRWHCRIGLFGAVFVLMLSVTGLMLNHTSSLKLDSIDLHSSFLADWYGLPEITPVGFLVDEQWIIHNGIDALYLNESQITHCGSPLHGAIVLDGLLNVLCLNELLLITPEGSLLERITPVLGLPEGMESIASIDNQLILRTPKGPIAANLDKLKWTAMAAELPITWSAAQTIPDKLNSKIIGEGPSINLERFLLDLHSGRLIGNFGVYVMDIIAVLLIIQVITGCIAWANHQLLNRRR